jgi:hypothetical protein
VVIATVFLTIIGGTVGFMLGERHRGTVAPSGHTRSEVAGEPTPAAPSEPSEPSCPAEAIQFAADNNLPTDLRQVFKIVTVKGSTVWICQDGAGKLYFQSKTGGVDAPLEQGTNGLFLDGVKKVGDDDYRAVATVDGNIFEVNRRRLVVHFANGKADDVQSVRTAE